MQRKKTMLSNNLDLSAHRPFHNIIVSSSNYKKIIDMDIEFVRQNWVF